MSKIRRFTKEEKYTKISNDTLQNKSLSFGARGLLSCVLSLPVDWELRVSDLYKRSPQGKTVIDRLISELKAAGHLLKITYRVSGGKFKGCDWMAFDEVENVNDVHSFLEKMDVDDNVVSAHVEYAGTTINVDFSPEVDFPTSGKPTVGKTSTTNKTYTNKTRTKETSSSKKVSKKIEEDLFENIEIKNFTKMNIKKFVTRTGKQLTNKDLVEMYLALKKANNYDDFDRAYYCLVKGEWEIPEPRVPKKGSYKTPLEEIFSQAKVIARENGKESALEFFRSTCKQNGHDYARGSMGSKYLGDLKILY